MDIINIRYLIDAGLIAASINNEDYFLLIKKDASHKDGYRTYALPASFLSSLPLQTGHAGEVLSTDGNTTSWIPIPTGPSYKVYTALLTQTSTSDPVAIELENTVGVITWEYVTVGGYKLTLPSAYDPTKTFIMIGNGDTNAFGSFVWAKETGNPNEITFYLTKVPSLTAEDNLLADTAFELRIYN